MISTHSTRPTPSKEASVLDNLVCAASIMVFTALGWFGHAAWLTGAGLTAAYLIITAFRGVYPVGQWVRMAADGFKTPPRKLIPARQVLGRNEPTNPSKSQEHWVGSESEVLGEKKNAAL